MSNYVIMIGTAANGQVLPVTSQYLKSFNFEAHDGRGSGVFTDNIEDAKKFVSIQEAMSFIRTQPKCKPLRED